MQTSTKHNKQHVIINLCDRELNFSQRVLDDYAQTNISDALLYPVLVFCDDLNRTDKLFPLFDSQQKIYEGRKKIIILKNKKNLKPETTWRLIANGIHDIIDWNDEADLVLYIQSLKERNNKINTIIKSAVVKNNLVGESRIWLSFLYQVIEAALFTRSPMLLIGESGTGKELISRLVHTIDPATNKKELILLDCTTIVPELAGSEFFGHERGSYTNALQSREGAFSLANNGTLFLDEIGELPFHLQAELLRVIQEGTYKKVGSNNWQKTNFRLVTATNKDIRDLSTKAAFRQDLYFRISDFEFKVPSLNERKEDILLLANHFLKDFFNANQSPELDDMVIDYLVNRDYPGNIRDLKQLVRRIALKHLNHKKITIGEIPVQDRPCNIEIKKPVPEFEGLLRFAIMSGSTLRDLKNKTMEDAIKVTLEICNGDKSMAARKLGVTLRAFQQFWKKNKNI